MTRSFGLCVLAFLAASSPSHAADAQSRLAQFLPKLTPGEIFPGADRFGPIQGKPPTATVFAAGRPVGYMFLNSDIVNSAGYSGKPIDIVVSLALDGRIAGARLMEHHEPIVLIGIAPAKIARLAALALVGHAGVELDARSIRFHRVGMQLTLNGIAQGYITDRIAELLLNCGIERALVDMGEIKALGDRPGGGPWEVGLEDPASPERITQTLPIRNLAVATSGGYGTRFDPAGHFNHIFDPANGMTSSRYLSVSVVAPRATDADALSTAFSLMPLERTQQIVGQLGLTAYFTLPDRTRLRQSFENRASQA